MLEGALDDQMIADSARFEANRCAHRRLNPDLKLVDLRLQIWAEWARPRYGQLGYPSRSVTERINEGGILARNLGPSPQPEWPEPVVVLDQLVAKLPTRHLAAVMAAYFYMALPAEQRAAVYARLALHLARTRPLHSRAPKACRTGKDAFACDLDRARWTLRFALATTDASACALAGSVIASSLGLGLLASFH